MKGHSRASINSAGINDADDIPMDDILRCGLLHCTLLTIAMSHRKSISNFAIIAIYLYQFICKIMV